MVKPANYDELRRLAVRCPSCRTGPRIRTVPWAHQLLRYASDDLVIITYECHVRRCREVYTITVGDLRGAA